MTMTSDDYLETRDMIQARASKHSASDLAIALVSVYDAFLEGATREQAMGTLTHRGVRSADAARIFDLIMKLTA